MHRPTAHLSIDGCEALSAKALIMFRPVPLDSTTLAAWHGNMHMQPVIHAKFQNLSESIRTCSNHREHAL